MKQKTENKVWDVEFVGDYFVLQTTVVSNDEQPIPTAINLLTDQYGFPDLEDFCNEINASQRS